MSEWRKGKKGRREGRKEERWEDVKVGSIAPPRGPVSCQEFFAALP